MQRLFLGKLGLGLGVVMLFFVITINSAQAQEWTPMISGVTNDLNDDVAPPAPLEPKIIEIKQESTPQQKTDLRKLQIDKIQSFAPTVIQGIKKVVEAKQITRDARKEQIATQKINAIAKVELTKVTLEKKLIIEDAMKAFVAYGVADKGEALGKPIEKLGEGERAGVVNSFKGAFGRLPQTEKDWEDVMKIAVGRFPSQTNPVHEKEAEEIFKKVYLRNSVRTQPNDNACVTIIAYGLRPDKRNLNSEKAAIKTFKAIFKKVPVSAVDWDSVRCIAYSGATRQPLKKQLPPSSPSILGAAPPAPAGSSLPDLIVESINIDSNRFATIVVRNQGAGTASRGSAPWIIVGGYGLDAGGVAVQGLSFQITEDIAPGATVTLPPRDWSIREDVERIRVIADERDVVGESNEDNNIMEIAIL